MIRALTIIVALTVAPPSKPTLRRTGATYVLTNPLATAIKARIYCLDIATDGESFADVFINMLPRSKETLEIRDPGGKVAEYCYLGDYK